MARIGSDILAMDGFERQPQAFQSSPQNLIRNLRFLISIRPSVSHGASGLEPRRITYGDFVELCRGAALNPPELHAILPGLSQLDRREISDHVRRNVGARVADFIDQLLAPPSPRHATPPARVLG